MRANSSGSVIRRNLGLGFAAVIVLMAHGCG
jgi:hypothetical protein